VRAPACLEGRAHHYLVASPAGKPLVAGACRYCGLTRDFMASEPEPTGKSWGAQPITPSDLGIKALEMQS
jgi:hypothetical protein